MQESNIESNIDCSDSPDVQIPKKLIFTLDIARSGNTLCLVGKSVHKNEENEMRKFFAMLLVGLFVGGIAVEAYSQGCCAGGGSKTETEESKDDSAGCGS